MPLYTTNLAPPESDSSQPDLDEIRTFIGLIIALEANNKYTITKHAFTLGLYLSDKDAFAIYRTALAIGMSLPKLNSFYDFKFQDKTSPIKKWLVAYKGNFRQPNKPEVNITWKLIICFIYTPNCILIAQINAGLPFVMP